MFEGPLTEFYIVFYIVIDIQKNIFEIVVCLLVMQEPLARVYMLVSLCNVHPQMADAISLYPSLPMPFPLRHKIYS